MNERRRPPRRGRGPRPNARPTVEQGEDNPYREGPTESGEAPVERAPRAVDVGAPSAPPPPFEPASSGEGPVGGTPAPTSPPSVAVPRPGPDAAMAGPTNGAREATGFQERQNGRRGRRNRGRGRREPGAAPVAGERPQSGPPAPVQLVPTGETT